MSVTKEVNKVSLVDKGPTDGSTGAIQPLWMEHVPYTYRGMGDKLCLGDKLREHVPCSPFLLVYLCVCVGCYGEVLEISSH